MVSSRSRSEGPAGSALGTPPTDSQPKTWLDLDDPASPSMPKPLSPGLSPGARFHRRRLRSTTPTQRSSPAQGGIRSRPASMSPLLRAAALNVANGAGISAVGFLKGHSPDTFSREVTSETGVPRTSWSSEKPWAVERCEKALAAFQPKLLDEKDIVAPALPPSGKLRPRLRGKRATVRGSMEEDERCSCCTKDEFWVVYDVFASMDRRQEGSVRRGDFVWSLSAHGACIEFQRVVRRSRLSAYFKSTAHDLSLDEFIHRSFPHASPMEFAKMQRWVSLRKARNIIANSGFRATEEELKQAFSLLEDGISGCISANELQRAEILSRIEVVAVLPKTGEFQLNFDHFRQNVAPVLVANFVAEKDRLGCLRYGPLSDLDESAALESEVRDKFFACQQDVLVSPMTSSEVKSEQPVAQPLPSGVVSALISRMSLVPSSEPLYWRPDDDAPPMCGMEQSALISAF